MGRDGGAALRDPATEPATETGLAEQLIDELGTVGVLRPLRFPSPLGFATMHEWRSSATNAEQKAREIVSVAMWLHTTFKNHVWLWRGQADSQYGVEPGIHSRVLASESLPHDEETARSATAALLDAARAMQLDIQHGNRLPDLALLAHLQHYGAATPLLDVTTDPLVALWMIAFASAADPAALDAQEGSLFMIKRPDRARWIDPLDARHYLSGDPPDVAGALGDSVWWYRAPDVTERLRIQRGSFLIGPLARDDDRTNTTLPLELANGGTNAIKSRISKRGEPSNAAVGAVEIFRIAIQPAVKRHLRPLLEDRSGLSIEAIYPTPWHRPYIEQFAKTYGRARPLELDLTVATTPMPPTAPTPAPPMTSPAPIV